MAHKHFEFGPFRLDAAEHLLLREEQPVQLPPKAFEMLLLLVENGGHVLQKNALMEALWPDSFVEESNLTQNVFLVRKALGEDQGGHQYVKTIPRVGYRFIAPVREILIDGDAVVVESHSRERIVVKEEIVEHEEETGADLNHAPGVPGKAGPYPRRWNIALAASAGLILVLGIGAFSYHSLAQRRMRTEKIAEIHSLAVLPFETVDEESKARYLGVGIADALIRQLGHLNQISVRPASAVQKYEGSDYDPALVGRELSVNAVLDGRIQKTGTRLLVKAQLFSTRDNTLLWSKTFEENYANIFSIQDEIAEQVAGEIATAKGEHSKSLLAKQHPRNIDAYEAYLKGRYFWNKRTATGGRKAVEYFKQSIEIDPSFAPGYAGLADCHMLYFSEASDLLLALPTFDFLVAKAIELDDSLAEPHAALAYYKSALGWDWSGAEKEFERAVALNPNYVTGRHWHAYNLISMGRSAEAIAEIERARQIDPVSLIINTDVGHIYYLARQNDQALAALQKALEMDPNFGIARERLGEVYARQGRYEEAIAELQKAITLFGGKAGEMNARLGYAYAASGERTRAQEELNEITRQVRPRGVYADTYEALILVGLGQKEQAFKLLYEAADHRDGPMALYKVDPMFDGLRTDPRSDDLLRRMNLPRTIQTAAAWSTPRYSCDEEPRPTTRPGRPS